ncbi:TrmH family RNA methyltransferase [Ornithinimicrobium cryptoxanthini]|uniref:RNA methyltransferase n=1 Tax=Ornithinimicrobium cryptoxanthini TaxID=2934161 RepID=A0ABY4YIM3_9MICO|nr:RNA methyltransferase [Ornithinimicrobium cryptoxanthini]USQ76614.1 RNA methyltransferase [Ornithinimicrobium cryptoxanthini]
MSESGEAPEVGVGPLERPWPTGPDGSLPQHLDPELLREGDRRNVVDGYRYWRHEAIVADLDTRRHGFHVAVENWGHDFNIGSVIRTANAFNAEAFHIVGRRRWNRRGAMVTDRYQHEHHHRDVQHLLDWAATQDDGRGIPVIGLDNVPGAVPLESYRLPQRCVLLLGQEGPGLSPEAVAGCEALLEITQHGSTRSINAGAAAAIVMYHWALQHA